MAAQSAQNKSEDRQFDQDREDLRALSAVGQSSESRLGTAKA
jgi:hypothetical protein